MARCESCSSFADKTNKVKCKCVCHKPITKTRPDGSGATRWDFRTGKMVTA